jgi:hypothetical protein
MIGPGRSPAAETFTPRRGRASSGVQRTTSVAGEAGAVEGAAPERHAGLVGEHLGDARLGVRVEAVLLGLHVAQIEPVLRVQRHVAEVTEVHRGGAQVALHARRVAGEQHEPGVAQRDRDARGQVAPAVA